MASKSQKIVYPQGVKDITDDLSTDDLVRRLKECAQAFQNMNQDDENSAYVPLALHLATENFMEHANKDVRLLVACCIADVFRVFAPEAPYKDPDHLKYIFEFFILQLKGLEDPKDATFKRYFYLLENLAWVKSFNICIELEENQQIFCKLFDLIFTIVNDNHSPKVKNFMLDMMCPLISEADTVSQELLDIILIQIIEPRKTHNKNSYALAKDILKRTSTIIEPYIQNFFSNALILGKSGGSEVSNHLYDLIYELNGICPVIISAVLPQLEFKLKSNDEKERLEVTRLLARMFSDKNSDLSSEHKILWTCFLGRFNDISVHVRMRCVQYAMHFLINHPELRQDITEQLRQRQHDPEENVRYEAVMAIISAAKKDFRSVTDELLTFVKERTLDKKFKIRKEALLGLAFLYKQHSTSTNAIPESTMNCISWIKNKVLHVYYQTALEDRLLVERILHTCLVPYQLPLEERMKKLYQLFVTVDDFAVKAFNELLKCQNMVRNQVKLVMECLQTPKNEERDKLLMQRIITLSKNLPEPVKVQEYIKKFCNMLENNARLRNHMDTVLSGRASCAEAELSVKEVLKSLGFPVQTNSFYMTIKLMLERVVPVMIDHSGVNQILNYINDSLFADGAIDTQLGLENSAHRGLQLLYTLSFVFTTAFHGEDIYEKLIAFLRSQDDSVAEITLQILSNIGHNVEKDHPSVSARLFPLLQNFVENGTVKQAKHAVGCLNTLASNKEKIFGQILDHLKQHLTLQSQYYRTALVSIGHIAFNCPELFGNHVKNIVSKIIVKELLMVDQEIQSNDESQWVDFDDLSEETKVKCEGMKMMVRWLVGLRAATNSALSTMKLLTTMIQNGGDLMERNIITPADKAWLRYTAASSLLKLCQEPSYAEIIKHDQFQTLAVVINDECAAVREKFAQKLHKGLICLKLPLDFMAVFSLSGLERNRELKSQFKQYLLANINKRRDLLKQQPLAPNKLFTLLPDYVMPYAIHLLAHDISFKQHDDVASLLRTRDCLWFVMEPLILKNENYSFSFFKKLIESIKQTRDKQSPDDDLANMKLYAVCDLALGLVMSKTTNFVLKEFPVEPKLPSKLYSEPDETINNTKIYIPANLHINPPKKSGLEDTAGPAYRTALASRRGYKTRNLSSNGDEDYDENIENQAREIDRRDPLVKRPRGRPRKYATGQRGTVHVQSVQQLDLEDVCGDPVLEEEVSTATASIIDSSRVQMINEDEIELNTRKRSATDDEEESPVKRTRATSQVLIEEGGATNINQDSSLKRIQDSTRTNTRGTKNDAPDEAEEPSRDTRQSTRVTRMANGSNRESAKALPTSTTAKVATATNPPVEEKRIMTRRR